MTKTRNRMFGALGLLLSVVPTTAFAEFQPTPEQRAACMGDAMRLCSSVIFSPDRIVSCLMSKKSQLSPQCQALAEKH